MKNIKKVSTLGLSVLIVLSTGVSSPTKAENQLKLTQLEEEAVNFTQVSSNEQLLDLDAKKKGTNLKPFCFKIPGYPRVCW